MSVAAIVELACLILAGISVGYVAESRTELREQAEKLGRTEEARKRAVERADTLEKIVRNAASRVQQIQERR